MFGVDSAGVPFTAGTSLNHAVMGHMASTSSVAESQRPLRTTFSQQRVARETASPAVSDAFSSEHDSHSVHYTCSDQPPYSTRANDKMLTQTSILYLPRRHPSYDLALFLRSTPPTEAPRKPSKMLPKRAVSVSKNALRFFRSAGGKRELTPVNDAEDHYFEKVLRDEGGLLLPETPLPSATPLPKSVTQKISSTGKRYLALNPSTDLAHEPKNQANLTRLRYDDKEVSDEMSGSLLALGSNILESRVSVSFSDDLKSDSCSITDWYCSYGDGGRTSPVSPISPDNKPAEAGADDKHTLSVALSYSPSPIRPPASNPPTPAPDSANSVPESHRPGLMDFPMKRVSIIREGPLRSSSDSPRPRKPVTPMPTLTLPHEDFPVNIPRLNRESSLKHPSPRRFASHPLLLERRSRMSGEPAAVDTTEAPATPPPKSPLRLRRNQQTIEQVVEPANKPRKPTPKLAPPIEDNMQIMKRREIIVPTVTTECTGPLTRTDKHARTPIRHHLYPISRKEREEKTRARKLRDRAYVSRTIDAVVSAPTRSPSKHRLRKARPTIRLPDLMPAPLSTRTISATSSDISWSHISDAVNSRTSPLASPQPSTIASAPSRPASNDLNSFSVAPLTPARTNASTTAESNPVSPVALVAEEVTIPKARSPSRVTRIMVSRERTYTPRPRSASMPRVSGKRRSTRSSLCERSRPVTPDMQQQGVTQEALPLPSPPPNRALPPTPPTSGSERLRRKNAKAFTPMYRGGAPEHPLPAAAFDNWPHHAGYVKTRQDAGNFSAAQEKQVPAAQGGEDIYAYVESLEKQVQMLNAALLAMLKTNGASNLPLTAYLEAQSPKPPMTWENRVSRRSEASHAASSSNGSALDMYMNTRTGNSRVAGHV